MALYWSADFGRDNSAGVEYEQVKQIADQLGLPVFCLHRGLLTDWENGKSRGIYPTVGKDKILGLPGISTEKKEELKKELLGVETPFQIKKIKDGLSVEAAKFGRKAYTETISGSFNNDKGSISVHSSYIVAGSNIKTPLDYVTNIERVINDIVKEYGPSEKYKTWREKYIRELAFHLFGFGSQAKEEKDEITYETAKKIVEQLVSWDECARIQKNRLDKEGNFIVTKEDLEMESI